MTRAIEGNLAEVALGPLSAADTFDFSLAPGGHGVGPDNERLVLHSLEKPDDLGARNHFFDANVSDSGYIPLPDWYGIVSQLAHVLGPEDNGHTGPGHIISDAVHSVHALLGWHIWQ